MSDAANNLASRTRNHRLRRGIYLLPTFFTVANLFCGYRAILFTVTGGFNEYDAAAKLLGLAILFDMLDGRVARATGTTSELGKNFDSLADLISFGVAPALLAYMWGARGILESEAAQGIHVHQLGWMVAFAFLLCCAWRLARFNVQGMAAGTESRFFAGMPTPAAAGMIAATVHAHKDPLLKWQWGVLWFVLVAGLAVLMASTIRYYGFKDIQLRRRQPSFVFVLVGLVVAGIILYSEEVLFLLALTYTFSGFTVSLLRRARHRTYRPDPVQE